MAIRRVLITGSSTTNWYKDVVGEEFDIDFDETRKITQPLAKNYFNMSKMKTTNLKKRLYEGGVGIRVEHYKVINLTSNKNAAILLEKSY